MNGDDEVGAALDELVPVEEEELAVLSLNSLLDDESIDELDVSFSLPDVPVGFVELELPESERFGDSFAEQLDLASLSDDLSFSVVSLADDSFSLDEEEASEIDEVSSCLSALLKKLVSSGPLVDEALSQPENASVAVATAPAKMNL